MSKSQILQRPVANMLWNCFSERNKTQKMGKDPARQIFGRRAMLKSAFGFSFSFGSVSGNVQYRPRAMMAVWFIDCIVLGRHESPGQPPFNSCHYYGSYYKFHRRRPVPPSIQTYSLHTAPFIHKRLFSSRLHISFIMFILDQKMT